MYNKSYALIGLLTSFLFVGCQTTQTSYQVDSALNYKKNRSISLYNFGITEEKVNDRIYFVTAKLEGTSSTERAKDMFYLHAANLAVQNNYKKFATAKRKGGRWCFNYKNNYTGQKSTNDGGPKFSGFVLLANKKDEIEGKHKIHDAQQVIIEKEPKVNAPITKAAMQKNEQRFLQACSNK